ncbi:hypothetical protein E6O75_ATG07715 [Venturia nashicola]|uniref:Cytokinesis regulator n=1 Tax=Venturia nashicola TaxID=86259 RepID=A0A4Z1P7A6_9PEZI|nr:hypothetical protein E6O75_ATG07715 [Venturia nashicola]
MAQVEVESWDDDQDFEQGALAFSQSLSTQPTSLSSRQSVRSESNAADEDWQVLITPNDESSISKAISSAKQVGIPIPQNVPQSALLGGTIKRLGKSKSKAKVADDWGDDFDIGGDDGGSKLQLKVGPRIEAPITPSNNSTPDDDFDTEWAEGSLGIRFAGTRRDLRGRSSSVSAMSPSLGSIMTVESEDDELGGLVLPTEPIDFAAKLRQRQEQEERKEIPTSAPVAAAWDEPRGLPGRTDAGEDDDMLAGLDFDDTCDFLENPKKRKINRNVKIESARVQAPTPRSVTTSLTFTDKPSVSRIPRPSNSASKVKSLDPVYESGATSQPPISQPQFTRFGRTPNTTSANYSQLLRSKRSAPVLGRPPTSLASRPSVPFLPAGVSTNQSQHVKTKSSTHFRQPSDHYSRPLSPPARSFSRMSITEQSRDTPSRIGNRKSWIAPAALARVAANQRTLHVQKKRVFGHGNELDSFDDLPTSATKEQKYMKTPVSAGPPRTLRRKESRANLNLVLPERSQMVTPAPTSAVPSTPQAQTPSSRGYFPHTKTENLPRFARDTAASRIAREQRLNNGGSMPRPKSDGTMPPAMNINWKAQVAARSPHHSPTALRSKKRSVDIKGPTLIKTMTSTTSLKNDKGMVYNAALQRWEGNESALTHFSNPSNTTLPLHPTHSANTSHHHHTQSFPSMLALGIRDQHAIPRHGSPPRPALISQVTQARGPRIERGMVFDPDRMKWLKVDPRTLADPDKPLSPGSVSVEEDDDPFAGIEDLADENRKITPGAGGANKENEGSVTGASMSDEWALGEEFDLGPTFIKRQRTEEAEWRKWAGAWFPNGEAWVDKRGGEEYKWSIWRVLGSGQDV